ncbi:hypothetical protein Q1695_015454 [Nippostrongylus brasiliensis]|nr:hypothetical protein Q1695_015454 [Nippostrongylus brasiliensis]
MAIRLRAHLLALNRQRVDGGGLSTLSAVLSLILLVHRETPASRRQREFVELRDDRFLTDRATPAARPRPVKPNVGTKRRLR